MIKIMREKNCTVIVSLGYVLYRRTFEKWFCGFLFQNSIGNHWTFEQIINQHFTIAKLFTSSNWGIEVSPTEHACVDYTAN